MFNSTSQASELDDRLAAVRTTVQKVMTPVIVAFGVTGNFLTIVVLTRPSMKSSTNRYLTVLAVYDILYLCMALVMTLSHYDVVAFNFHLYRYVLIRPLMDTCSNTTVWLTLTFTVERYIGVCHPMKGKVWCTPRRARSIIAIVCVMAAVVTFPEFFEMEIVSVTSAHNVTTFDFNRTALGSNPWYSIGYIYTNQTLFTFAPLLLLLCFNAFLIRQVIKATARRRLMATLMPQRGSGDRQSRDQQRITCMLISVVIVFIICQLPQATQHLYRIYIASLYGSAPPERTVKILLITGNVFNLLVVVNSSTNFILYSSFSTKFRRTFSRLFCRCLDSSTRTFGGDLYAEVWTNTVVHGAGGRKACLGVDRLEVTPIGSTFPSTARLSPYLGVDRLDVTSSTARLSPCLGVDRLDVTPSTVRLSPCSFRSGTLLDERNIPNPIRMRRLN